MASTVALREGFCTEAAQSLGSPAQDIRIHVELGGGENGEWYFTGAGDCAAESALINDGTTHAPAGGVACALPAHQPTVPHVQRTSAQPALRALIISMERDTHVKTHNCIFKSKNHNKIYNSLRQPTGT